MKKKTIFYEELVYIIAISTLALGSTLMVHAKLGVSVVVAPAYILSLNFIDALPFFTYGFAQYAIQAVLLILLTFVLRRFHWTYMGSFFTAFLFGLLLDFYLFLMKDINLISLASQILFFSVGLLITGISIGLFFRTYLPLFVYELVVKELSVKHGISIERVKIGYDIVSCLIAIALSFLLLGFWNATAIGVGTIISAFLNGPIIEYTTQILDRHFIFKARFPSIKERISPPPFIVKTK